MTETTTMTIQIAAALDARLDELARDTNRPKAVLASEAIAAYVDYGAWQVAHIETALAAAENGAPTIPHEDIARWMESWDTADELPPPEPQT